MWRQWIHPCLVLACMWCNVACEREPSNTRQAPATSASATPPVSSLAPLPAEARTGPPPWPSAPAVGTPPKLPGSCVSPLEHAQLIRDDDNRYGSSTGKPPLPALREADVERWLDLDGDGTDDVAIATVTKAKPFDMRRREIYVMRGPCGHHVGRIVHPVDSSPRLLSSRNNGLRDIELPHGACNEHYTCSAAYRFDGRRYVIVGPPFRCRRARCRLLRSD